MERKNSYSGNKLNETFIWTKKIEKQGLSHVPVECHQQLTERSIQENQSEIQKLEKDRQTREILREQMREENEFLQRMNQTVYHEQWEQQQDTFDYNQARLRSKIRIQDDRAKPIDLLIHYITEDNDLHEPTTYLNGLTIRDLEDLLADIKIYTQLESKNCPYDHDEQFWEDITMITEDELRKLSLQTSNDRTDGINPAVFQFVMEIVNNKTLEQLEQLEQQIKSKIENETEIDITYWETLLSQLQVHMARTRLYDKHQSALKNKLRQMKQEQGISVPSSTSISIPTTEKQCIREYEEGRYSPILININDLDVEIQRLYIDEMDDWQKLKQQRESVMKSGFVEDALEAFVETMGTLTSDDSTVNTLLPIDDVQYLWSDKYRPRKPRVFNKVHTGYDWNQFNKKHYDSDNPPPKTVQGYKFNIFYPDLIDKTKTPSYSLTICEDNRDFALIKFHAGPPYEDIGFKIVHKEWDFSHRHGFRCQFQNGIFQLWFHFRKLKYRR